MKAVKSLNHYVLVFGIMLSMLVSGVQLFSQETVPKLKVLVYYSTIAGSNASEKGNAEELVFRTTFFVYLINESSEPISVATKCMDWPEQLDGSRITVLSVKESYTPRDQPVKQSPGKYDIVRLEKGEIADLGKFYLMGDVQPVDLDLYKFIYKVDAASALQLGLWQGQVVNSEVVSTKEAKRNKVK